MDLWLWICGLVSLIVILDFDSVVCIFLIRDLFLWHWVWDLWFWLFGMGSLVWDLCFETFAALVSNLCADLFNLESSVWDICFETCGSETLVWNLWFVCFGLRSLVWACGFAFFVLFFSAELRFTIFGLGSLVWDLGVGSLVWDLWLCIFDPRSLISDLWIEIFGVRSLAVPLKGNLQELSNAKAIDCLSLLPTIRCYLQGFNRLGGTWGRK